jgi:hypothetical protein
MGSGEGEGNVMSPDEDAGPYASTRAGETVKGIKSGPTASRSSVNVDKSRSSTTGVSDMDAEEVRQLKQELAEVRESQLRMEEMLNKMLNPASGGK